MVNTKTNLLIGLGPQTQQLKNVISFCYSTRWTKQSKPHIEYFWSLKYSHGSCRLQSSTLEILVWLCSIPKLDFYKQLILNSCACVSRQKSRGCPYFGSAICTSDRQYKTAFIHVHKAITYELSCLGAE